MEQRHTYNMVLNCCQLTQLFTHAIEVMVALLDVERRRELENQLSKGNHLVSIAAFVALQMSSTAKHSTANTNKQLAPIENVHFHKLKLFVCILLVY